MNLLPWLWGSTQCEPPRRAKVDALGSHLALGAQAHVLCPFSFCEWPFFPRGCLHCTWGGAHDWLQPVLRYSGHSAKSAFAGVSLTFPKQGSLSLCWNQTALKWRPLAITSPHSISAQCHFLSGPLTTLFKIAPPLLLTLFFSLALIAMSLCHIPPFVLSCFVLVYLLSGILVRLKAGGRQGFCWFCSYCAGSPFLPAPLESILCPSLLCSGPGRLTSGFRTSHALLITTHLLGVASAVSERDLKARGEGGGVFLPQPHQCFDTGNLAGASLHVSSSCQPAFPP